MSTRFETTTRITDGVTVQLTVNSSKLYVAKGVTLGSINSNAVTTPGANNTYIENHGDIFGDSFGIILTNDTVGHRVYNAFGATIGGGTGIYAASNGQVIINYGDISGLSEGINWNENGNLYNYGTISSQNIGTLCLDDGGISVIGATFQLYNFGDIIGAGAALSSVTTAALSVLNEGRMVGDVTLGTPVGAGRNVFDSRLGEVFGKITGGDGADTILGPRNGGNIDGGGGNDLLVATGALGSTLNGGAGSDVLKGADGDDLLIGGTGLNQLWGGDGSDTASYSGETQQVQADLASYGALVGGILRDTYNSIENLIGGQAADVLVGDAGANRIQGGRGSDQLYGRGGADTFVYAASSDSNLSLGYDTIADFETGVDKIDLSAFHLTPAAVTIVSSGNSTALYAGPTVIAGSTFYSAAIAFIGGDAVAIGDIIF